MCGANRSLNPVNPSLSRMLNEVGFLGADRYSVKRQAIVCNQGGNAGSSRPFIGMGAFLYSKIPYDTNINFVNAFIIHYKRRKKHDRFKVFAQEF